MPRAKASDWRTPEQVIELLHLLWDGKPDLDPCASPHPEHHFARENFCLPVDGIEQRWKGRVFVNPPFDALDEWTETCALAPRPLKDDRLTFGALHEHWEATRGASCRSERFSAFVRPHASGDVPDTCPSCGHDTVYARPIPRRVTFHGLRHSFGTAVVAAGGTGAGQALLAHSDPRMTQRYTHLADGLLGSVVARAFEGAAAAPGLQNGEATPVNVALLAVAQRNQHVGPPGIEPGLRSRGSRF